MMLAVIEKVEGGYIARYDRLLHHTVEKVWKALTHNEKLGKWMPNLQLEDLKTGGTIKFNMNDGTGTSFVMKIRACIENEVLDSCLLVLKEFIKTINDHTPKDLAGWHVCLDVFADLLRGRDYAEFPKENWEKWYRKYKNTVLPTE